MKKTLLFSLILLAGIWTGCSSDGSESEKSEPELESKVEADVLSRDIMPITETNSDLNVFFDDALNKHSDGITSSCFFKTYGIGEEVCFVINSLEDFASLYSGEGNLPTIDFDKYTLVLGKIWLRSTCYTLQWHGINAKSSPMTLDVCLYNYLSGLADFFPKYFWGLYPKFEYDGKTIDINKFYVIKEV